MRITAIKSNNGFILPMINEFKNLKQDTILLEIKIIDQKKEVIESSENLIQQPFFLEQKDSRIRKEHFLASVKKHKFNRPLNYKFNREEIHER